MQLLDSAAARETFESELERVPRWYGFYVTGYVVMPEHMHLVISEPERGELSVVIQMLKQITSRKPRVAKLRRFWQIRYYDFPVWSGGGVAMEQFLAVGGGIRFQGRNRVSIHSSAAGEDGDDTRVPPVASTVEATRVGPPP